MFKKSLCKFAAVFAFLVVASPSHAERAPNEYASWKSCKVGTTVRLEARDSSHPNEPHYQMAKLVKVDGDELTIEESSDSPGNTPRTHVIKPAPVGDPTPDRVKPGTHSVEQGDTEMYVAGRKVKAHWTKETYRDVATTIYTSDEVPSGFVEIKEVGGDASHYRIRTWTIVEINVPQ